MSKAAAKKITKHDCFLQYASLELIPHWRKIFEDCAHDSFPKGISYKDGVIYAKKGKKKPVIFVLPTQPQVAIDAFKKFLHKELGEISIDDMTRKRLNLDIALKQNAVSKDIQWSEIRAPTVKQHLITLYVSDMKQELDLSEEEARNMKSVLNIGLNAKQICNDDVIMENGKIVTINGVDFDENGFFIERSIEPPRIVRKVIKCEHEQQRAMEGWERKITSYCSFMSIVAK